MIYLFHPFSFSLSILLYFKYFVDSIFLGHFFFFTPVCQTLLIDVFRLFTFNVTIVMSKLKSVMYLVFCLDSDFYFSNRG